MTAFPIDKFLYFATDKQGITLSPQTFAGIYEFQPDGVNIYVSLDQTSSDSWKSTGHILSQETRDVLAACCQVLEDGAKADMQVNLGLEPSDPTDPFGFALAHLDMAAQVAREIAVYCCRAEKAGKSLDVTVRYASEFNDGWTPDQPWGRPLDDRLQTAHATAFRQSLASVNRAFKSEIPKAQFTFSPALRSDVVGDAYNVIADYIPALTYVDCFSCTWYVNGTADLFTAASVLHRYVLDRSVLRKPFGIDELGGADTLSSGPPPVYGNNDPILQFMLQSIQPLASQRIAFRYACVFLAMQYGADATLSFLRP